MSDEAVQRDLGRIEARLDAGDERMGRIEGKIDQLSEKLDHLSGQANRAKGAWSLLVGGGALGAAIAKGIAMFRGSGS